MIQCLGCGKHLHASDYYDHVKWRRCRVCVKAQARERYHACEDTRRGVKVRNRGKLLERYGLTWESFTALLEGQGGRCAICETMLTHEVSVDRAQQACVDHDHVTGAVRGILCSNCNLALGYLKDNAASAHRAALYLEEHNGVTYEGTPMEGSP